MGGAATDTTMIAYPGDFHDVVRDFEFDRMTKSGALCVKEVALTLSGVTARLDILCRGPLGFLAGIEIKTGFDPPFTPQQMIVYPHVIGGAGVISTSGKINILGLPTNAPLPPFPIFVLYAPGPGLPYHMFAPFAVPLTKSA
jgi:hypothetical protein